MTTRRDFLKTAAATTVAGTLLAGSARAEEKQYPKLKKALIGKPTVEYFEKIKAAGFDGIETRDWGASEEQAKAGRKAADETGMTINSVMRGWTNFNKEASYAGDIESVKLSLENAAIYGADAILLVPCRTGGTMPKPWDFKIDFDPKTCIVKSVAAGDNSEYAEYIEAQNQATEMSKRAIESLIPTAEKTGVQIAIENVWNNLWVTPELFAAFVKMFNSPWVKAYFDIGNHVKYATPQKYIETLGDEIVKLHVKDFTIDKAKGNGGSFVNIREGDVDWPVVRQAIADIGYTGWMTIEGSGGLGVDELSKRLDLIIAGK